MTSFNVTLTNGYDGLNTVFELKTSNIPNAGLGIFATEDISGYWYDEYHGTFVEKEQSEKEQPDRTYCWALLHYDEEDGSEAGSYIIGYRDAKNIEHWTKYVNCSTCKDSGNVESWQEYDKMYYGIETNLKKGEELLTWYGEDAYNICKQKN